MKSECFVLAIVFDCSTLDYNGDCMASTGVHPLHRELQCSGSVGDSGSSKNIVLATLPWATGIEKLSSAKQQAADPSHMIQGGDPWAVASTVTGLRYDVAISRAIRPVTASFKHGGRTQRNMVGISK